MINRRVSEWLRLSGSVGLGQLVTQGAGFLAGIAVVRTLPESQYALYTLAYAMLGTISVLADAGIGVGVMAEGGKVWQDRGRLGSVILTGLALRRRFALFSVTLSVPVLLYMLRDHGASWANVALLSGSVVAIFILTLYGTLLTIAPRLHQDMSPYQRIQMGSGVLRLIGMVLVLRLVPWAWLAIAITALAQYWMNRRFRSLNARYADMTAAEDPQIKAEILRVVRRVLPGAVYYCVAGQLGIWLLSFFGSTAAVAQLGALGRIGQVMAILSSFLTMIVEPRFSRLPDDPRLLLRRFFQVQLVMLVPCAAVLLAGWWFPAQILWLLGAKYSMLTGDLLILLGGSCASLLGSLSFGLPASRGWVLNPAIMIPVLILAQVVAIVMIDHHSVRGVLWIALAAAAAQWVLQSVYAALLCLRRLAKIN